MGVVLNLVYPESTNKVTFPKFIEAVFFARYCISLGVINQFIFLENNRTKTNPIKL